MDVINESYEKYLMSIGVMYPSLIANVAFVILLYIFNVFFVYVLELDYVCLAWSWVISLYLSAILQIVISLHHPSVKRTLQPLNKKALTNLMEFVYLGIPGSIILCSEWWAYQILAIFASHLGTAEVDAQSTILQIASLVFMIPLGMGVASASLVGNSIGASYSSLAIRAGKFSIYLIIAMEFIVALLLLSGGHYFVDLFTSDIVVKQYTYNAMPFLALFVIVDGIQGVASGVLRGAGKQVIGAATNCLAFYAIGIPLAYFFCFKAKMNVNGLMFGMIIGTSFQLTILLILIFYFESYIYSSNILSEKNKNLI
jgi:MATE family multidrug resistance protein